jgi:hypothetical protein
MVLSFILLPAGSFPREGALVAKAVTAQAGEK